MNQSSSSRRTTLRLAGACATATRAACLAAACLMYAAPVQAADGGSEKRPIGAFRTVRLVGSADLLLKQGDAPSLVVEGDKGALSRLTSEIRGDELVLAYESRSGWWSGNAGKGPRFVLTTKTLDRLSTSGSGDVHADALTVPSDFEISISGSSDVTIGTLAARKLLVRVSGSGDVTLGGGVLEQNIHIAGAGDYRSARLQSATATISIAGSGDATLWARDSLSVKIAGSGDVKYYGRPTVTKSIAGSGSVTGLGDKP